ncbi:hypothetical protein MRX96_006003 [Rhipicephalus microplus]
MEVDSGAARSIMSKKSFRKLRVATSIKLEEADTQLVTWTKEELDVIRKATLPIKFKERDSKLPLLVEYQQLVVNDASADVLTISSVKGLYKVRRLPFGVSVAPGLFQRTMDTLFARLLQVAAYLDNILVASETAC